MINADLSDMDHPQCYTLPHPHPHLTPSQWLHEKIVRFIREFRSSEVYQLTYFCLNSLKLSTVEFRKKALGVHLLKVSFKWAYFRERAYMGTLIFGRKFAFQKCLGIYLDGKLTEHFWCI